MSSGRATFSEQLEAGWAAQRYISVGLDGEFGRLPADLAGGDPVRGVLTFHRQLVEATKNRALAYKPQIAGYEQMGADGFGLLLDTIELVRELAPEVPVILDAKRADIGVTNERYAHVAFDLYGADAVTVHPYLGPEAMKPFTDRADKGVIVLCRTSNPGSGAYQDLITGGRPLYQHIAEDVATTWNYNSNCGLVVGATYPNELKAVRASVGRLPVLVPGIGAQGGDLAATVASGTDDRGAGLVLHASRSIMYAYEKHPDLSFVEATQLELEALHQGILGALPVESSPGT